MSGQTNGERFPNDETIFAREKLLACNRPHRKMPAMHLRKYLCADLPMGIATLCNSPR